MSEKVATPIVPSLTRLFHMETAQSAPFNYLYNKKHSGEFIVCVEDTDQARSKKEYEDDFTYDVVRDAVWEYDEEVGKGDVLWLLRVALSGKERSPGPFLLAESLGKEETLTCIQGARVVYS